MVPLTSKAHSSPCPPDRWVLTTGSLACTGKTFCRGLRNQIDKKRYSEYAKDLRACRGRGKSPQNTGEEEAISKSLVLNAASQYCCLIFYLKETENLDFCMSPSFQDTTDHYAPFECLSPSAFKV